MHALQGNNKESPIQIPLTAVERQLGLSLVLSDFLPGGYQHRAVLELAVSDTLSECPIRTPSAPRA